MAVIKVITAIFLLVALWPMDYNYYIFLRGLMMLSTIICGIHALEFNNPKCFVTFMVLLVIYNPVLPVHLNRPLWSVINVATIVIYLVSIPKCKKEG